MATHSSILAYQLPWTQEPGERESIWGRKESDMTEQLTLSNVRLELTRVIYFPCLSSVRP